MGISDGKCSCINKKQEQTIININFTRFWMTAMPALNVRKMKTCVCLQFLLLINSRKTVRFSIRKFEFLLLIYCSSRWKTKHRKIDLFIPDFYWVNSGIVFVVLFNTCVSFAFNVYIVVIRERGKLMFIICCSCLLLIHKHFPSKILQLYPCVLCCTCKTWNHIQFGAVTSFSIQFTWFWHITCPDYCFIITIRQKLFKHKIRSSYCYNLHWPHFRILFLIV